jgi:hypothetical protein
MTQPTVISSQENAALLISSIKATMQDALNSGNSIEKAVDELRFSIGEGIDDKDWDAAINTASTSLAEQFGLSDL